MANFQVKDFTSGLAVKIRAFLVNTDENVSVHNIVDSANAEILGVTTGTKVTTDATGTLQQYLRGLVSLFSTLTFKAASTAPVAADPALVVAISPNGQNANGQTTMANSTPVVIASDQSVLPVANFTPNGNYATLTATASSSASTALPAGAVVAFQNTSNVDVSLVLSAGAATATTNKIILHGGSTTYINVGSNVNAAGINQTGSASNVIAMAGGTGLGTSFGTTDIDSLLTQSATTPLQTAPQPVATGGLSVFRSLDMDETEEEVKATAGCLYKLRITNRTTSVRYVKLYNATAASVTVGTTTPIDTITVPAGGSADLATVLTESFGGLGLTFSTALCIACTTGFADNDTGAPGTNDVIVSAYYK